MADLVVDPDIRRAKTLPSAFYTDEVNFELSKEKIFARTWQFAGRVDEFESLKPFVQFLSVGNIGELSSSRYAGPLCRRVL